MGIHQLALCTCYSRKDSYWYSSMKDLNSLPLTTENSGLGSNFPFKILIFELRSFPPLKFPMVTGWAWIFSGATNLGTLCIHCCPGAHVPQLPHDMTPAWAAAKETTWQYYYFLSSFLSLIFSFLHISSPHPKDNYSVGCISLILQYTLSGPPQSRVFTMHHK